MKYYAYIAFDNVSQLCIVGHYWQAWHTGIELWIVNTTSICTSWIYLCTSTCLNYPSWRHLLICCSTCHTVIVFCVFLCHSCKWWK